MAPTTRPSGPSTTSATSSSGGGAAAGGPASGLAFDLRVPTGRASAASTDGSPSVCGYSTAQSESGVSLIPRSRRIGSGAYARTYVHEARDWALGTSEGLFLSLLGIGWLLLMLGTLSWHVAGGNNEHSDSLNDSFWISWGLFFDPGTQTGLPASDPGQVRFVAVCFSVFGFVFNLTLLGTVVEGMRNMIANCKEVYSRISTSGHVLVLGWGDKTLPLLCNLLAEQQRTAEKRSCCAGCCRRRGQNIVVLAERPVSDMRQDVRMHLHFEGMRPERIEYREGSPMDRTELMKVSAPLADDILVMGSTRTLGDDQEIIQICLALGALPGDAALPGDIFVELQSAKNRVVASTILPTANGILANYALNRILVLRAVVPSIGYAFLEMINFRTGGEVRTGDELYMTPVPEKLLGVPFRDACGLFPDAVVCGVRPAMLYVEDMCEEQLLCNGGRTLQTGDRLLVMAGSYEDASRCCPGGGAGAGAPAAPEPPLTPPPMMRDSKAPAVQDVFQPDGQLRLGPLAAGPKTVIVLGCPLDFPNIMQALDCYLATGSEVHVLSSKPIAERREAMCRYFDQDDELSSTLGSSELKRVQVTHLVGDLTSGRDLRKLPLDKVDSALILAERSAHLTPCAVDSKNLAIVIALRGELNKVRTSSRKCKVVTELLDPKTQQVLDRNSSVRRLGSFVYSNCALTGVFAMAAAEKTVFNIWSDLLDPAGGCGHVAAAPVRDVVRGDEELSFYDLQGRVWDACGGILLGWRRMMDRYPLLNPGDKAKKIPWNSSTGDELIMLRPAEGDVSPTSGQDCGSGEDLEDNAAGHFMPPGCAGGETLDKPAGVSGNGAGGYIVKVERG